MSSDKLRQVADGSDEGPKLFTALEVSGMLRVHVESVKRWAAAGTLKGMKVGGRWRFNIVDVEDFQRRCRWKPAHDITAEHTDATAEHLANPSGRHYALDMTGDTSRREGRHQKRYAS